MDVADEQQVDAGTGSAIKAFGALDILVSNASKSSLPSSSILISPSGSG
jgi:NAD(P)-dependent dehydrogenase (short-subunit alcohol dehydrogenase family)